MKTVLTLVCVLALALAILPALLYCGGTLTLDQTKHLLLASAVLWFPAALLRARSQGCRHNE